MNQRVLVAEDEEAIRNVIVLNLEKAGFSVVEASSGEAAMEAFLRRKGSFEVVLLDVMMGEMSGFDVVREIRMINKTVGIIMLTAKSQEEDKVHGFVMGADDYITKPFSPAELVARVDAVCRRVNMIKATKTHEEKIQSGKFVLDMKKRVLFKGPREIQLTQKEFRIMQLLLSNINVAMERDEILRRVWEDEVTDVKIVDVNIRRLRMKIEDDPSVPKYIHTVWGCGYMWSEWNEDKISV